MFLRPHQEVLIIKPENRGRLVWEARLIALKLLLDALDVPPVFWRGNKRTWYIQVGVYLAQQAGFGSNYRFRWAGSAIVSEDLLVALHELALNLDANGNMEEGKKLSEKAMCSVLNARNLLVMPYEFESILTQQDWASALMTIHYIAAQSGGDDLPNVVAAVDELKPELNTYVDRAIERLWEAGCFEKRDLVAIDWVVPLRPEFREDGVGSPQLPPSPDLEVCHLEEEFTGILTAFDLSEGWIDFTFVSDSQGNWTEFGVERRVYFEDHQIVIDSEAKVMEILVVPMKSG